MYREIEEALVQHPDVKEVCVIAMRTEERAEKAGVCVVLNKGAQITPETIEVYCKERVTDIGCVDIRVLPAIPKGPTGMVSRRELLPMFGIVA